MKYLIVLGILAGFLSPNTAVSGMTPLCEQVYGANHYGDSSIYGAHVVLGETYAVTSSAGIGQLQKEQVIALGRVNALYNDDGASQDEKVDTVLQNTDDKNAIYQVITVTTTGTSYEQYRIYLGDTEVSALFLKGTLFMVARTSDAECYQDETTDEIETVNEQISLARKQWVDLGPFENKKSVEVALQELNSGVHVSLYVRKGQAPSFSHYDCRRKSKYDEDMSCTVAGEGAYYVAVYRYAASGGALKETANVTVSYPVEKEAVVKPVVRSGILARGKKHYLGPFHADASFKAVLHGLDSGVSTNIYVKKGSQAEYWNFDCRKSSRTHDDLSCTFDEPGDYDIQVYRSRSSGGREFELYAVDITIDAVAKEAPHIMVKRDQTTLFMNKGEYIQAGSFNSAGEIKVFIDRLREEYLGTLYVRKGARPDFNNYDCKKNAKYDSDLSCQLSGAGEYFVAVYMSRTSSSEYGFFPLGIVYEKELTPVEKTVKEVLDAYGVPNLEFKFDEKEVRSQMLLGGTVTFQKALEEALHSFLTFGADYEETPLNLLTESGYGHELCSDQNPSERVRCWMNNTVTNSERVLDYSRLEIVYRDYENEALEDVTTRPEGGESVDDNWIFSLYMPVLSDHLHWAVVDRKGESSTYNYGFN